MVIDRIAKRLLSAALLLTASLPLMAGEPDRWLFRVFLDDREIGYHEFTVTDREGGQHVQISAEFDVKFLFINAYSYDHQNRERWAGNCLEKIDALTNDNGAEHAISGQSSGSGFAVSINRVDTLIDSDCARTFAYWNPIILESDRLLNSQTGEWIDVAIEKRGADLLQIGPNRIPAEKFTIVMKGGPIHLWYSPGTQHWLALEAQTEGGRMLRYVPVVLPAKATSTIRLAMD